MRITSGAGSRGTYFDRITSVVNERFFSGAVAPHSATLRLEYTVPQGQRLYISLLSLRMVRDNVPLSLGSFGIQVVYKPFGGATRGIIRRTAFTREYYAGVNESIAAGLVLNTYDNIAIYTYDVSTGGSTEIELSLTGFLFER